MRQNMWSLAAAETEQVDGRCEWWVGGWWGLGLGGKGGDN